MPGPEGIQIRPDEIEVDDEGRVVIKNEEVRLAVQAGLAEAKGQDNFTLGHNGMDCACAS